MGDLPLIQVVGIGAAGASSLSASVLSIVESATVLVGGKRHLERLSERLSDSAAVEGWLLGDFDRTFERMRSRLQTHPQARMVVLASGDPLFFGLGRLLLANFPREQLVFHPHASAIQLAFSRLKLPWQNATLLSVHGRGEALLLKALKRGDRKIALLTDNVMTPGAIARLIIALDSPARYQMWVCENLGGADERVGQYALEAVRSQTFAPLNVVVLCRQLDDAPSNDAINNIASDASKLERAELLPTDLPPTDLPPVDLPLIGLPDSAFYGFPDRPTLMTKRQIRLLILGELAPRDGQVIWDIGAGTGSVSVELSRLCPKAKLYAIEKTAAGASLIERNAERLAIAPIHIIRGSAPVALSELPRPNCVFIGGSSGQLIPILDFLHRLNQARSHQSDLPNSNALRIVMALATAEHLASAIVWATQDDIAAKWTYELTQINIARSLPVGSLTRLSPLNPVTLMRLHSLRV